MADKVASLLNIARHEIGTRESPPSSNRVKYNTWFYGREVSGSAYPWCMAFVQWCFERNLTSIPHLTASCGALLSWYRQYQPECIVKEPQKGDIAIFDWPGNGTPTDHTGIVESVSGRYIITIEGNTAVGNDSNGGEVMRRQRDKKYVRAYIRPKELYEEDTMTQQEFNKMFRAAMNAYRTELSAKPVSSWAAEALGRLKAIVGLDGKRVTDGSRPGDLVTREEVWAMLDRIQNRQ